MSLGPTIDHETAALCSADRLAQQLRGLFYKLDRAAERNGWAPQDAVNPPDTSRATLYILEADRGRRHLSHKRAELFTATLRRLNDDAEGNTGRAMLCLADSAEWTRDLVTEVGAVSSVQDAICSDLGDNWAFHGMVFTSEAWSTQADPGSAERAAARARQIHTLPNRVEIRMSVAFTRDGYLWYYSRARGEAEAMLVARKAGEPGVITGGIAHALARMVNAIVAQQDRHPVPEVGSADHDGPIGWVAPNTARTTS